MPNSPVVVYMMAKILNKGFKTQRATPTKRKTKCPSSNLDFSSVESDPRRTALLKYIIRESFMAMLVIVESLLIYGQLR